MEVNVDNKVEDIDVKINKNEDGSIDIKITEKGNLIELGEVKHGDTVLIGKREYIVLEQNRLPTDDGNFATIVTKNNVETMKFGTDGNYLTSYVRKFCNENFYNELVDAIGKDNIASPSIYLICDDGSNKGTFCDDYVSLMTAGDYRHYRELIPSSNEADDEWWTATRVTSLGNVYNNSVCLINGYGVIDWDTCDEYRGVRPFCRVNSHIMVEKV